MSYARGFLKHRVILWQPVETTSEYGKTGIKYQKAGSIWANVTWSHGARALNHGNIDVYDTVMVRSDIHTSLTRRTRLEYAGEYYIIDSYHSDEETNECQITAHAITDIQQKAES